jgi:hypothetical protein
MPPGERAARQQRFRAIDTVNQALRDHAERLGDHRIIGRIRHPTPAAHRRIAPGDPA